MIRAGVDWEKKIQTSHLVKHFREIQENWAKTKDLTMSVNQAPVLWRITGQIFKIYGSEEKTDTNTGRTPWAALRAICFGSNSPCWLTNKIAHLTESIIWKLTESDRLLFVQRCKHKRSDQSLSAALWGELWVARSHKTSLMKVC